MATKANSGFNSSRWLSMITALGFSAVAIFILSKHIDEAVGKVIVDQEPELSLPMEEIQPQKPIAQAVKREDEGWDPLQLGAFTLELPGEPTPDPKPGWFSRYKKVESLAAYRVPLEHRLSHVRVSTIRYTSGKISLQAAALAAKHGMDSEFSGVSTVYPFNFRNLPARHIAARPVDVDDLTRMHTYLVLHDNQMLILTITGHDKHPGRLAHQILKTIQLSPIQPQARTTQAVAHDQ